MSAGSHLVLFVAMAIYVSVLLGVGIVAASGYWTREERETRARAKDSRGDGDRHRHGASAS